MEPLFLPTPLTPPAAPRTDLHSWHTDGEPRAAAFVVGVDLGQARDFTAIVVNEVAHARRTHWQQGKFEPVPGEVRQSRVVHHRLRHVERVQLGTSYPDVLARVAEIMSRLPVLAWPASLVMDATGCGRPVLDMARKNGLKPLGVTITGGTAEMIEGMNARVAKKILASSVAVALESERVKVQATGPHVTVLRDELRAFKVKVTDSGSESFESWREADHDDLVLAAALAIWQGERLREPFKVNPKWQLLPR